MLSIVISAYNEEGNILELYHRLTENLAQCSNIIYEILFVNDGSTDKTLERCLSLNVKDKRVRIINFSRNFGHEIAMTAGLDHAKYDTILFMDADLQHPPEMVPQIIQEWQKGNQVILTKRIDNEEQTLFKKICNFIFYKVVNILSDTEIPANSPDFRLIGKKYVNILRKMEERERMFRGLLNWVGVSDAVEIAFSAPKRFSGKTHYNFTKSLSLAVSSIVQFSVKPLRLATYLGVLFIIFAALFIGYTIFEHFYYHQKSSGYATLVCVMAMFFSVQMIILGIMGEYIARIHIETKGRPLYVADIIE